jgi:hypothetical protein
VPHDVTELHGESVSLALELRGVEVGSSAEVEAWFEASDHPLKDVMLAVREEFLRDPRVDEAIKWKSPTFIANGNIASIDPKAKAHVSLMFHQGAKLGDNPSLEGGGGTVRYMRFADLADVRNKRKDLRAALAAWFVMRGV